MNPSDVNDVLIASPQCWYRLFPHGAEDLHLLKHYLQLLFFSYSDLLLCISIPIHYMTGRRAKVFLVI